jgi:predicted dehydrogenase
MIEKVKKENVRMMVGVNYRYFPCCQQLKAKLDSGQIGDPIIASSELILNGPISHDVVPKPVPEWWLDKNLAGGGALVDLGYHLIDILCWMFGDFEVKYANIGHSMNLPVEDSGTVFLKSKNGNCNCVVNAGWFSKSIFPNFNFRVNLHGTAGYDSTSNYIPSDAIANALKQGLTNMARKLAFKKMNYLSYTYYYASFYKILDLYFESLRKGTDFPVELDKQLDVIRIIESAYKFNGVQ